MGSVLFNTSSYEMKHSCHHLMSTGENVDISFSPPTVKILHSEKNEFRVWIFFLDFNNVNFFLSDICLSANYFQWDV